MLFVISVLSVVSEMCGSGVSHFSFFFFYAKSLQHSLEISSNVLLRSDWAPSPFWSLDFENRVNTLHQIGHMDFDYTILKSVKITPSNE